MLPRRTTLLALLSVVATPSDAAEVYRRAVVLEDRVGRVEIRNVYGVRLAVLVDCKDGRSQCPEERVYDEVVRLDFSARHRERADDDIVEDETPMGSIQVALSFLTQDRESFRSEMAGWLRRLSAEAFVEPFAGWAPMKAPFDSTTLSSRLKLQTWVCFQSDTLSVVGQFDRKIREGPDGPVVTDAWSRTYRTPPTMVCDQMTAATTVASPKVIETLPSPKRLLEVVIDHHDAVRIQPDDPDALIGRPEGVLVLKREAQKGITGESSSEPADGGVPYASRVAGGWRFDGYAEPAAMPIEALDRDAWVHEWTVRTIRRQLGPDPSEEVISRTRLLVAYLATLPAAVVEHGYKPGEITLSNNPPHVPASRQPPAERPSINRHAFVDALTARFDRHRGPPQELLEELVASPPAGLESEGWIVVVCRDDGSATYYLPPTNAYHRVTNADLFCGAVETRLGQVR